MIRFMSGHVEVENAAQMTACSRWPGKKKVKKIHFVIIPSREKVVCGSQHKRTFSCQRKVYEQQKKDKKKKKSAMVRK